MTYEQFWEQDVELARYYREAWKIKRDVRNQELWLQGAYVYEAILDAAPVLHTFAKKGTRAAPYPDHPYDLYGKRTPTEEKSIEAKSDSKAKAMMEMMMISINKKFQEKGGGVSG
jgi:hypothetical protein